MSTGQVGAPCAQTFAQVAATTTDSFDGTFTLAPDQSMLHFQLKTETLQFRAQDDPVLDQRCSGALCLAKTRPIQIL